MKRLRDHSQLREWWEILRDALILVLMILIMLGIFAMLQPGVVA